MKKIIATALCITLGAPCFAMGPMGAQPVHQMPAPHASHHMTPPPPKPHHQIHHRGYHMSPGAKTAVAVAGVAGLAMVIAAIAD